MRKHFNTYLLAGLAATSAAIIAGPVLTNLYLSAATLIYAALLIIIGAIAAAVWSAGPEERRTNAARWAIAGAIAGSLTAVALLCIVSLGFFLAIGFGLSFGNWAVLAVAFTGAALVFAAASAAHWLAWRYATSKTRTQTV